MLSKVTVLARDVLRLDNPSKTQPFDEILFSRTGERHSTGVFAEIDGHRWERGRVDSIKSFSYDRQQKKPFSVKVMVDTVGGRKELYLTSCDFHYLAPYVPAESVDGLVGCVVPVMYSVEEDGYSNMGELFGDEYEPEPEKCMLSAENGYLVADEGDFNVRPEVAFSESD